MKDAIGMIETYGLVPSIVAADAMVKAAQVSLVKFEKIDAGMITIIVQGDISAVKASVDAGELAAKRVGIVLSAHVISRIDTSLNHYLKDEAIVTSQKNDQLETAKSSSKTATKQLNPKKVLTKKEIVTSIDSNVKISNETIATEEIEKLEESKNRSE